MKNLLLAGSASILLFSSAHGMWGFSTLKYLFSVYLRENENVKDIFSKGKAEKINKLLHRRDENNNTYLHVLTIADRTDLILQALAVKGLDSSIFLALNNKNQTPLEVAVSPKTRKLLRLVNKKLVPLSDNDLTGIPQEFEIWKKSSSLNHAFEDNKPILWFPF